MPPPFPQEWAAPAASWFLCRRGRQAARLFGYPQVPLGEMLDWVADWVVRGGETHGKPTKFEVRDGTF